MVGITAFLLFGWACSSTAPSPPPSRTIASPEELTTPYILDPLIGYPFAIDEATRARVREIYGLFDLGTEPTEVRRQAADLLMEDPDLAPAMVLLAQVDLLERQDRDIVDRLDPIVEQSPDYLPAALLRARALERLGEIPEAYRAYDSLASRVLLAEEKASEMRDRAEEIVQRRFEDALERGRVEDAEEHLIVLREFAPEAPMTLEYERQWLEATGDREAELELIRRIGPETGGADLYRRWGHLETDVGDVRRSIEIFNAMVGSLEAEGLAPDAELLDELARAKFVYRLELLPQEVRQVSRDPELDRADLALLLYWLFPEVRYSQVDRPPIAQDVLEEPFQEQILRVLDVDLMGVDTVRHRFEPRKAATRSEALAALLTLLVRSEVTVDCVVGEARLPAYRRTQQWICHKAAQCGLVPERADCLPAADLSGPEAMDLFRRAQEVRATP